jgi:hypothetical protein
VNHFPVKRTVSPTIDTAYTSTMILQCEHLVPRRGARAPNQSCGLAFANQGHPRAALESPAPDGPPFAALFPRALCVSESNKFFVAKLATSRAPARPFTSQVSRAFKALPSTFRNTTTSAATSLPRLRPCNLISKAQYATVLYAICVHTLTAIRESASSQQRERLEGSCAPPLPLFRKDYSKCPGKSFPDQPSRALSSLPRDV